MFLKRVGELDDEDAVFRNESHQRYQADLAVDIERGKPDEGEEKRAREGQRHGAEEDDERIAEALELRGQHQEDEDEGEGHRDGKFVAFQTELARASRVVDGESFGQDFGSFLFEDFEGFIQRHSRLDDPLDAGGVELLEAVEGARLGGLLDVRERGKLHELSVWAADVEILELVDGEPFGPLDLRDDFVAAALNTKAVDVVAAEEGAKVRPDLPQVKPKRGDFVAIKDDLRLRQIVFEVGVGEEEQAALDGFGDELVCELQQLIGFRRGGNHDFHRERTGAGERFGGHGKYANARNG